MGSDIFHHVGDGLAVHLLADTHGVECLEQKVNHGFVGLIASVDNPYRVFSPGKGYFVVLFVGKKQFGDSADILNMVVLCEGRFLRAVQCYNQCYKTNDGYGCDNDYVAFLHLLYFFFLIVTITPPARARMMSGKMVLIA